MFQKTFNKIWLTTDVSVLTLSSEFDEYKSLIKDNNIEFPILASSQAIIDLINCISSEIERDYKSQISSLNEKINNLEITISSLNLIDNNNNFYMPNGLDDNVKIYRMISSYNEPETNEILLNPSQNTYKKSSDGLFIDNSQPSNDNSKTEEEK